jgi:hypothetical protein
MSIQGSVHAHFLLTCAAQCHSVHPTETALCTFFSSPLHCKWLFFLSWLFCLLQFFFSLSLMFKDQGLSDRRFFPLRSHGLDQLISAIASLIDVALQFNSTELAVLENPVH